MSGAVNLTCDAWQASNVDRYFAATGHWIEESSPGTWELQCAIIGFTILNNSHNGQHLGQALYKIVDRVGIAHKVSFVVVQSYLLTVHVFKIGHITCDNASNNDTMLYELAL